MYFSGEIAISSFFEALFANLASPDTLHFATEKQVQKELNKLETVLKTVHAVLADAEEKQLKDQHVKMWLSKLRDLAFEVDDILDEFATEALHNKLTKDQQAHRSKVRKIIHSFTASFGPNAFLFRYKMMNKIKAISSRLDDLITWKNVLQLREFDVGRPKRVIERPPTSSLVNEALVYGREYDKNVVIDLLLMDSDTDVQVSVVPIVGIGGIGKTTLAQLVYNDNMVQDLFDVKAWVCVSEDFNIVRITKSILPSITCDASCNDVNDLNLLQVKLKEKLSKKKFLLVLDDIWNMSYNDWTILRSPFEVGDLRSKILVTTRNQNVSSVMKTVPDYSLKELSNDDCLFILAQHSIGAKDFSGHLDLKELGEQIVKKCKGLPLAAKTIGGLLRTRVDPDAWKDVLENEIWNSSEEQSGIIPALRSSSNKSQFMMHDLINDLARSVAGDICFRLEGDEKISSCARYSSFIRSRYNGFKRFHTFGDAEHLRTFMSFLLPNDGDCYLSNSVLIDLVPRLRRLRVLSLEGFYITKLPDSVGDLTHIRYLNFSYTKIKSLPESICTLLNLQTLLLRGCDCLKHLPSDLRLLANLQHLDITDANSIEGMPFGIGELIDLQSVSNFVIGQGLEHLVNAQDAAEAMLFSKFSLDEPELKWSADVKGDLQNAGVEKEVLSLLQPHKKLKKLSIKCYGGQTFPTWVGYCSLKNLMFLEFEHCHKCTSLPAFGQLPFLKALYVKGMDYVNKIGVEFYGENCSNAFPALEILCFEEMPELKEWNTYQADEKTGNFNCLRVLSVKKCPKLLGSLPSYLPCLKKLVIHDCQLLEVSVPKHSRLYEIEIVGCKRVRHDGSLDLCSIKKATLSNITWFSCLKGLMLGLSQTEFLRVGGCRELPSLCHNGAGWLARSSFLRNLEILNCSQLVSMGISIGEQKEEVQQMETLCSLEHLRIKHCEKLEKLSATMYNLTSLRELEIVKCPKLLSFSHDNLPLTLKGLVVKNCDNLKCLLDEDGMNISRRSLLSRLIIERCHSLASLASTGDLPVKLQHLKIWSCPKLAYLSSSGYLPVRLKHLRIDTCQMLESIADSVHNTCLESIFIARCEKIQYLPDGLDKLSHLQQLHIECFRNLVLVSRLPSTGLRVLHLSWCRKLQALPNGLHCLTYLQELEISNCPCLLTFPEEGFPTNLTSLTISKPEILEGLIHWGFHKLTSLKRLAIYAGYSDGLMFPHEGKGMMLPCSLSTLSISDFPNVETLSSKGFENLPFLECLSIVKLPKLKCLPGRDMLMSLLELYIHDCPLLKKSCRRDEGKDWSNIARIPFVQIDNRFIYDSEEEEESDSEE
ncbi:disease resistance protein RGA2-like [Gossypium australe]|uniref:Disease resistance protein RGA2-like n=1 Tax=Gossypium australe TaxID=47621 RepID=A0A5B6UIA9_9ROSI|nr:disease resistance protein RGA2-like [Gossypium australe]